jgi:hypothetical protein
MDPMESPGNRLQVVQATLALAARLTAAVHDGRVDESMVYLRPVNVETGGAGLRLEGYPEGTKDDLLKGTQNLFLLALSNSALTTDEVLQKVFGNFDPQSNDPMVGIRVMVNQLRNAFARRRWRPTWIVKQQHLGVFPVVRDDNSRYDFDTWALNGQGVKGEDLGGIEFWVKLIQHCERLVGSESAP